MDTGLDRLEQVRASCRAVAARARHVTIDHDRLGSYATALKDSLGSYATALKDSLELAPPTAFDMVTDPESTAALVITIDAVNFGSGWFPVLWKRPGASGYRTIEACLLDHVANGGPIDTRWLRAQTAQTVAELFEQTDNAEVATLMTLYARALKDLGAWLDANHDGSFLTAVTAAGGSCRRLVDQLLAMPLYQDTAVHDGQVVHFYKRAQITASDLASAFHRRAPADFTDLDSLTLFADNLVPHVLRIDGVLQFDAKLTARIGREELLAPGEHEEVEIRAVGVHAVELLVGHLEALGCPAPAWRLDQILWQRGGEPRYKAHPRHRSRNPYY